MTLPLLLVLIAAVTHATWNLIVKQAAAAGSAFLLASGLVMLVAYLPWLVWELAKGATRWPPAVLLCIGASGVIHLAYSLSLQRGYRAADLSVVYPVARGTGPLLASIGAFVLLREVPTLARTAGLIAVIGGITMIATNGRLRQFAEPAARQGVAWGLLTGALIAAYTLVDAYGVMVLALAPVVLDWFANALRVAMLAPAALARPGAARTAMQGHWGRAVAVGLLSPLGYILVLTALQLGAPLSFVAPAREMSMMVGAIFGMVLLREKAGVWRLGGCGMIVTGVILLGAS